MTKSPRPLTGVGLTLFRIWLYAPFPLAFGVLAIMFATLPNRTWAVLIPILLLIGFAWLSFLWVRRLERKFGLDGLTVQKTLASFGMMVLLIVLYPIMSHQSHVWLHPNSKEYDHWEMLPIFAEVVPTALLFSNRLSRMREGGIS